MNTGVTNTGASKAGANNTGANNTGASPLQAEGITKFLRPELEDLRADIVYRWKASFGDAALSDAIFENPRLQPRLIAAICASQSQPRERMVPVREDAAVVAALITHGSQTLAEMVGCLCHRAQVMDWITWNQFSDRLPDVDLPLLRHCLRRVRQAPAGARGDTPRRQPVPNYAQILQLGKQGLAGWRREAAPELVKRMNMFVTLPPPARFTKEVEVLRQVAPVLLEERA